MNPTATAVKEHGLIFSAQQIPALMSGTKTQDRRIVSARNSTVLGYPGRQLWDRLRFNFDSDEFPWSVRVDGPNNTMFGCGPDVQYLHVPALDSLDDPEPTVRYRVRPVYEVGERLWVRESYKPQCGQKGSPGIACGRYADGEWLYGRKGDKHPGTYLARGATVPAIHLPRWASRITLEITDVRAARVKDISEEDAIAEGCKGEHCYRNPNFVNLVTDDGELPQEQFQKLWASLHGPDSWNRDWVWALSLKRIEQGVEK